MLLVRVSHEPACLLRKQMALYFISPLYRRTFCTRFPQFKNHKGKDPNASYLPKLCWTRGGLNRGARAWAGPCSINGRTLTTIIVDICVCATFGLGPRLGRETSPSDLESSASRQTPNLGRAHPRPLPPRRHHHRHHPPQPQPRLWRRPRRRPRPQRRHRPPSSLRRPSSGAWQCC